MDIDWDALVLAPVVSVFGTAVTYTPNGGQSFSLIGVFDKAYLSVSMGDSGVPMTTESPVLGVRLSQFPAGQPPRKGDQVLIIKENMIYTVKDPPHFDGHGHAKLMLTEKCAGS